MSLDLMKIVPLPDYLTFRKVLFIGPHPDDIEIGAGATVSKLVKAGAEVYFLITTDGGAGSKDASLSASKLIEMRKKEAEAAAEFLGVNEVEILSFYDGGSYDVEDLTTEIIKRLIRIKPDTVFAPDPLLGTETHPDHLKLGEAARRAISIAEYPNAVLRRGIELDQNAILPGNINLLYFYTSRPNIFIPITKDELEAKFGAIKLHRSQMDESFEGVFIYLDYQARTYGKRINGEFGEGFFALSPVHQHCFTENI